MDHRLLGRTGVRVSPLCLGAMNFGGGTAEADAVRIVHAALDAGINFVDTADVYNAGESERIVGKALAGRRDKVILATKVHGRTGLGPNDQGNSRLHILRACDASLRRLGTDYIDLYQVHRPSPDIPVDETLGALTDLVRAGKVRYIGCSTHPAWMVMEALAVSERLGLARYVSEQPPYNLLDRRIENELVPLAQRYGLAILPWAPLARACWPGATRRAVRCPPDSRAVRQPGQANIYADRVTPRGIEVGRAFADLARSRRPDAWPAGAAVVQGPAGHHRADRRPADRGAVVRVVAGARLVAVRRRTVRVRRARAPRRRGDQLPQHRALDEDADSMKLAFIGTHGTGKTTLCYDVTAGLKRQGLNADMVKEVARLSPLPINRKTSLDAQTWILMTQVAEEIRSGSAHDVVVCDRSVLDNYAYMVLSCGRQKAIERFVDHWMKTYDVLVKVPMIAPAAEDGVRDTDEFFVRSIDQLVDTLLAEKKIPHCRLDAASRDGWVDQAMQAVTSHPGLAGRLI